MPVQYRSPFLRSNKQSINQVRTKTNSSLPKKKTCMCSPTSHPGSFRCSLHKNSNQSTSGSSSYTPNRLNMRRSAMANSMVRIGGVEGDWVKRALSALIRPFQKHKSVVHIGEARQDLFVGAAELESVQ
ncbi:hypothetical protein LINPERHAP2_LOCUS2075 [Linum perenne]